MRKLLAALGATLAVTCCAAYPDGYGYPGYGGAYGGYDYPVGASGYAPNYGYGYGYAYSPNQGYGYGYSPQYGYAPGYQPYYGAYGRVAPRVVVPATRYPGQFGEARREFRQDRREDRREFRQERRDDRREFRQERRAAQGASAQPRIGRELRRELRERSGGARGEGRRRQP